MARRLLLAGPAVAVTAALLTSAGSSAAPRTPAAAAVRVASPPSTTLPAYAGPERLRAVLADGDPVSYPLSPLPAGAARVLGDWNGDGAQTPGIFLDGQWTLSTQLVRTSGVGTPFTFGQAGDRPVTGDWNGDGITDIGVVRGDEWLLATGPFPADGQSPPVWRDLTFADPADPTGAVSTPVAGDWNGDGRDSIGMFVGGRWTLADRLPASGASALSTRTVWFGRAGDQPVVGDWAGVGTDSIGVARGPTWYLRSSLRHGATTEVRRFAGQAGDVPLGWPVPGHAGTTRCPTRRTTTVGHRSWVVPSRVLGQDVATGVGTTGRLVRGSLEQTERYLLGAQYDAQWRATRHRAYLSLLGLRSDDELSIRLPAMSALTVAVGLRTGALDPGVVGTTTARATHYVDQLVRSIACAHAAVSPGGWGNGWETAQWAMLTGAAAWLVWDRLTPQTRSDVAAMVVGEAEHQLPLAVPYWRSPDGTDDTPGDTKAEEDAWNAGLLALASAMMPAAPDAHAWRAKAAELGVAAYSVPADNSSRVLVNGVSLRRRVNGYNALPDGTVVNHHIIHPDYAAAVQQLWLAADFDRLAGRSVPEAMFHDGGLVYSSLSTRVFTAGDPSPAGGVFAAPGGTVYRRDSPSIYYPQGDDWGTARRAHFVSLDAHAAVYARYLHATGWSASAALDEHEHAQRHLWRTSGADDGRTYSVDPVVAATEDTYAGREEYAAQNLATAWLALYVGQLGLPALDRHRIAVPAATNRASRSPSAKSLGP